MSTLVTDSYNVSFSPTTCYRQCRRKRVRLRFIFQFTRPAPEVFDVFSKNYFHGES